ncbi:MAG TPA: Crp/Fnr family transcriptional regulator [Pyrinomonadaceae bacterium]|nr:Crp/Fnr family transcriptional regulator [Pyrinomonadaceae bacterium]
MSSLRKTPQTPENRLLAALPAEDYQRLLPELQPVTFSLGEVLYESQGRMEHVYFPTSSHISLLYTMIDGSTAEVGLVGNEGLVGIALFMGGDTTPNRAIVQGAGDAYKMKAWVMQEEFKRGGTLQYVLLRYTQALITQISQTAVCNRLHTTEQRLCRWILMTHDRTQTDQLDMTHEFIANMLGIQREAVSLVAHRLREKGAIDYKRGSIRIIERRVLEEYSCECYQVVKAEHQRLMN